LALAAMIAGPAVAADMPVKAPPPVAYYDWSGAYLGLNIGGVWADVNRFYPNFALVRLQPQTFTSHNNDVIYGFHAGAQWQRGQWVLGVEAAYSAGSRDIQGTVSLSPPEPFTTLSAYNKIGSLFTVGPRLGYAWGRWMVFGTGGYAIGQIHGQYACTGTGIAVFPGGGACSAVFGPLATLNATGHTGNDGWFAGGGFEYMVLKGSLVDVILGAEYQHFDLRDKTAFCFSPGCAVLGMQDHIDFNHGARGDIVRARVAIKTQGWGF
jgi:outer membrane immunogenic protein